MPHRPRAAVMKPYDRLIQVRNKGFGAGFIHGFAPLTAEEWESIGTAIVANLRHVLEQFTFLQRYDLIHLLDRGPDGYTYMTYTGVHPTVAAAPLHSREPLELGSLYLLNRADAVLPLRPMLIPWDDPQIHFVEVQSP